jgi:formylglycine-generating enzyme required for sulfatase activity
MALAFETQKKNRRTIEIDDAVDILTKTSAKKEGENDARYKWIQDRFNEIEPRCGLFNRLDGDKLEFTHLTFQEFLAAKHMVYMEIDYTQFLEKKWWEETLLLYTGFLSIDLKRRSNDIVETILTVKEEDKKSRNRFRLLGARALCDIHESKRDEKVVSLARERLYELIESDAVLDQRFRAGVLVGGLGDTRISPDNMVLVPEGEFTRGRNEGRESAKPEQRIYLDAFMIGAYPVTNREFKRFIEAGGYQKGAFWTPEGWQWRIEEDVSLPRSWYDRKWNGANFPVVGVSWYEAAAYAAWLGKETGKSYRLPTEAEWEKAARGTDGKIYPWGNKFNKNLCNSRESELGRTSPVGIFPGGKSSFGCFDMAGNVWEWCADWYDDKYYRKSPLKNPKGPVDGSPRVLRGGSWLYDAGFCASAIRYLVHPALRGYYLGFRLARSL